MQKELLAPLLTDLPPSDNVLVVGISDQKKDLDRMDAYALEKAKLPLRLRDKLTLMCSNLTGFANPIPPATNSSVFPPTAQSHPSRWSP